MTDNDSVHLFLVRVRLEVYSITRRHREWRGHIDHVVDGNRVGERVYFRGLSSISRTIRVLLEERDATGGDTAGNVTDP